MSLSLWQQCLARLQDELPATEFSMWIRPLQAELSDNTLALYAPNRFVLDWVRDKYLNNINGLLTSFCGADAPQLRFEVGTKPVTQTPQAAVTSNVAAPAQVAQTQPQRAAPSTRSGWDNVPAPAEPTYRSNVNVKHTFDNFVEGKSNQLARAAARQVADNPGGAYNPLFLYGGTTIFSFLLIKNDLRKSFSTPSTPCWKVINRSFSPRIAIRKRSTALRIV